MIITEIALSPSMDTSVLLLHLFPIEENRVLLAMVFAGKRVEE